MHEWVTRFATAFQMTVTNHARWQAGTTPETLTDDQPMKKIEL
jgi:hypothetical protein